MSIRLAGGRIPEEGRVEVKFGDSGEQTEILRVLQRKSFRTSLVVWCSELLTTNQEVPGSISGSTIGIFLVGGGSPW